MSAAIPARPLELYQRMLEIRHFEAAVSRLYKDGKLPGFVHVSLGQEAAAVGACAALEPDDYITSTHRGHGHCLAKGADAGRMMAELYAKGAGYSKGRGGSMHIADMSVGVLGANGIVGQSSPLALGAALTSQVKGLGRVALAFFGEGASGAGPTMEAMNIAALWKLPAVFFCEANRYAELSPFSTHCPTPNVATRAAGFGFEGVTVDGNDVLAVYAAVKAAADKARAGGGPTLVEAKTHRWHGHYEGDPQRYVSAEDRDEDRRVDPIPRFAAALHQQFGVSPESIAAAEAAAVAAIDAAIAFAEGQQSPPATVMLEDVYA
jgi:acetoin:2,6-dichlorophenolindophenol oxidoreductase subunit alpha